MTPPLGAPPPHNPLFEALHNGTAKLPSLEAIKADRIRRDLKEFVKHFWDVLEQGTKLEWNWHLDRICDALMCVARRELRGLVICVPPGTMKSLLVSVFYPAWAWLPGNWPDRKTLYVSGTQRVSFRDSYRTRLLLESPEYQHVSGLLADANDEDEWQFAEGQNEKQHFENTCGGARYALTVGQRITGLRGSEVVVDDPFDVEEVIKGTSDRIAERMKEVLTWYDQKLYTRRNDLRTDPIIIIMQRLHMEDLAGAVMERNEDGYRHLVFPLEYDPEIAVPEDPRTQQGEILDPVRFPSHVVNDTRAKLGEQYSAQYGQRPVPGEGGMFKKAWFVNDETSYPWVGEGWRFNPFLPRFHRRGLFIDCANKAKQINDFTVMGHIGQDMIQDAWLLDLVREKLGFHALLPAAKRYIRAQLPDFVVIEDAGNGTALIDMLKNDLDMKDLGVPVFGVIHSSDDAKDIRASNTTHWWSSGRVHLPDDRCPWVIGYRSEHLVFPSGKKDDQVDMTSMGLQWLHDNRTLFRHRVLVGGSLIEETGDMDNPLLVEDTVTGRRIGHVVDMLAPPDLATYKQPELDQGKALWATIGMFIPSDD